MDDPVGVHITRIYVNSSQPTPSPVPSSTTIPVCTSTPITNIGSVNPSARQPIALPAKDVSASQDSSEKTIQKTESKQDEQYVFISKETGQQINFKTGEGIAKAVNSNTGTITKKKIKRQSLAVVPPLSMSSSKSSDDGDYLVPINNTMQSSNEKQKKANFTSYNGIQAFTFTLDDD